ncbi:MAG: PD40 domain-containing protein, partial [Planctomycetes bacterium]|nr:PD40 domain-containing protein [Planctomycetota bacterium]
MNAELLDVATEIALDAPSRWAFVSDRSGLIVVQTTTVNGDKLQAFRLSNGELVWSKNYRDQLSAFVIKSSQGERLLVQEVCTDLIEVSSGLLLSSSGPLNVDCERGLARMAISPDGMNLAAVTANGEMSIRTTEEPNLPYYTTKGNERVSGIYFSPDGEELAFTSTEENQGARVARVKVLKLVDGGNARVETIASFEKHISGAVSYTENGRMLAFALMSEENNERVIIVQDREIRGVERRVSIPAELQGVGSIAAIEFLD